MNADHGQALAALASGWASALRAKSWSGRTAIQHGSSHVLKVVLDIVLRFIHWADALPLA